jgi:hypothetical protein
MANFRCQRIGDAARRLLAPGVRGQVLAGFSSAAYLNTEETELFWLVPEGAPMHPRALQVAGPFPKLVAGEAFCVQGERVSSAGLHVDFGAAFIWAAPPVRNDAALRVEQIPARVKEAFSTGLDSSQASGFGRLIPAVLALSAGEPAEERELDPVLAVAWPAIREMAQACLVHGMRGLLRQGNALVGLGEGLTPSGDDFLGGLLFCINTMQRLHPGYIDLDPSELALFVESAGQRTHAISFALLHDLANGQAVEPLHQLIQAVWGDRPPETIRQCASRLTQIGHSTGWDLLTGALTGLLLTFRGPERADAPLASSGQSIHA